MRPAIRCRRLSPPGRRARVQPMATYTAPTLSLPRIRTVGGRSGFLGIPTALGKAIVRHCHSRRGPGCPSPSQRLTLTPRWSSSCVATPPKPSVSPIEAWRLRLRTRSRSGAASPRRSGAGHKCAWAIRPLETRKYAPRSLSSTPAGRS